MRFNRRKTVMELDTVRTNYPELFLDVAAPGLSSKYRVYPTGHIIEEMYKEGWAVVNVSMKGRLDLEAKHAPKHQIGFRRRDQMSYVPTVGDVIVEPHLTNSYDGTCAYVVDAGLYRLACANGLMLPESVSLSSRVRHTGHDVADVIEGTFRVLDQVPAIGALMDTMKSRVNTFEQRLDFATKAAVTRWGEDVPIDPKGLLDTRRREDTMNNQWITLNVVQENLLNGGFRDKTGRKVRAVTSFEERGRINKEIFELAMK
jgi:hypothetical protein